MISQKPCCRLLFSLSEVPWEPLLKHPETPAPGTWEVKQAAGAGRLRYEPAQAAQAASPDPAPAAVQRRPGTGDTQHPVPAPARRCQGRPVIHGELLCLLPGETPIVTGLASQAERAFLAAL